MEATKEKATKKKWRSVRDRIGRIHENVEKLTERLHDVQSVDRLERNRVLERLEALQVKFEKVMGQLAFFDDESDESIREAKTEFLEIVRRYRSSRQEDFEHKFAITANSKVDEFHH